MLPNLPGSLDDQRIQPLPPVFWNQSHHLRFSNASHQIWQLQSLKNMRLKLSSEDIASQKVPNGLRFLITETASPWMGQPSCSQSLSAVQQHFRILIIDYSVSMKQNDCGASQSITDACLISLIILLNFSLQNILFGYREQRLKLIKEH